MKILICGPTETGALRTSLGLTLADAPPGTAQTPIAPLAGALRKLGHDLHILTLDPTITERVTLREGGVVVTYCPLRAPPRYRTRVRAFDLFEVEIRHLTAIMKESGPDIVHAHWTYEYAEAAVRSRLPHLVTMHDLGWEYFWLFRDAYRFMRLAMKYRVMPRINHLTVVAPFMAAKARHYGYFGLIDVIPNGIEIPELSETALAQRLERPPCLVTIGDPGRVKNVRASVEAFRLVRQKIPKAELHLFGPGLDDAFAKRESGVFGHGKVAHQELMEFLTNRATLLVHSSLLECCPVIIEEAKARAVPAVGGLRSGGVPFVCGVDAGCAVVDVQNPQAIYAAIDEIFSNLEHYQTAARRSNHDARTRFENIAVASSYLIAYQRIVRASSKL